MAYLGSRTFLGGSILGLAVVGAVSLFAFWVLAFFAAYSPVERADLLSVLRPTQPAEVSS